MRIDKEELRWRLVMLQYLCFAMCATIRLQDPTAGEARFHEWTDLNVGPPEALVVVFINTRSGDRHRPELKERLHQLIAEEQIAGTTRKLGILVVANEVYHHLTFGTNPFVPMGVFGSKVPILTLGPYQRDGLYQVGD
nr:putative aminotransferase tat2 [Quercus suber]